MLRASKRSMSWRTAVCICAVAISWVQTVHAQEEDEQEPSLEAASAILAKPLPQNQPVSARQFVERVRAARALHDSERLRQEITTGLQTVGSSGTEAFPLLQLQAQYHADRGDLLAALAAREQALAAASLPSQQLGQQILIVSLQTTLRDRPKAATALAQARDSLDRLRRSPNWVRLAPLWQARFNFASARYQETFGTPAEAETSARACIASMRTFLATTPEVSESAAYILVSCSRVLVMSLLKSGRSEEAESVAQELRELARALGERQERSAFAARFAPVLAQVALERGRLDQAHDIIDEAISRLRLSAVGEGANYLAQLRYLRGAIAAVEGDWTRADEMFEARRAGLESDPQLARRVGVLVPEWIYVQLRLGHADKAMEMADRVTERREALFGDVALATWEARGMRALALAATGKRDAALLALRATVPRLTELAHVDRLDADAGLLRTTRLQWIFQGYLDLLVDAASRSERIDGLDPVDESFGIADLLRGSRLQSAMASAASRAVVANRDLDELARRYHQQQRELGSLSDGLADVLAPGRVAGMDDVVSRIRADLAAMRSAQAHTQSEIAKRFPNYMSLVDPRAPRIAEVQRSLQPGEVLMSIFVGETRSIVWAIPKEGAVGLATSPVGSRQVAQQVARVRSTLDPTGLEDPAQIRAFDFANAHALYRQFVLPTEAALKGASALIVVANSELSQLPFAVLLSEPVAATGPSPSFEGYAKAPWLVQRFAISQLPSAAILPILRSSMGSGRAERPFVGFGDPAFSGTGVGATPRESRSLMARRVLTTARSASGLSALEALPETAQELREIAKLLGADEDRDIYLGARASEVNVRRADLAKYQLVMFATHGLLPGQIPGLGQPALALSGPTSATDSLADDGLLTLDEILGLRLRSDWVVLSACSTAAPDGLSSEAASGLGRAFFFAGARSMLATSWPIETRSARVLTTSLFQAARDRAPSSRAQTLRLAELWMMQQVSQETGMSYAHPMFWAPYVLIGDGS